MALHFPSISDLLWFCIVTALFIFYLTINMRLKGTSFRKSFKNHFYVVWVLAWAFFQSIGIGIVEVILVLGLTLILKSVESQLVRDSTDTPSK
ncbi:TPA: hypothetical protein DIU27_04750 [Candidatus Collierbacteria bacterium]|uniref:Uncharacterized protein n=1 Tax=Candidatus Collierbacteria bacterium GW2011_GWB2_44_22 TaxID=1618387 RepID=A0A0G1HYX1_9BACT|nr:MAG: hypothetical protein UW31_C0016G0012 [Candidatus Collierbacteria bacterium GW2011_GWA2_44_13]KKT51773.1 MAG: hypothetical protein UW44_C0008G0095 [Candidatus Collierbacteria bacterium GW2011_GWB2_44_22]KKT65472.1 MAG: hypothetical protein UW58_C0029G0012 [Candidatus Collierbacteria bacterium GW2011_GWC2_44_30]KKT68309.1 MAG: hypothetical protein UW64_C0023G0025 [Microgenomates group bacterium GW2011_GWC1_44_37]KKT87997.1 MAG: hypothetical protein UW88_C0017G0018 [Candidatus Collierbacte